MNTPRYWQNHILFQDGSKTTLTIQSETGRSDLNEKIFILQSLGGVRALQGWKFNFLGSPQEIPAFVPAAAAELLGNQIPYWFGPVESLSAE